MPVDAYVCACAQCSLLTSGGVVNACMSTYHILLWERTYFDNFPFSLLICTDSGSMSRWRIYVCVCAYVEFPMFLCLFSSVYYFYEVRMYRFICVLHKCIIVGLWFSINYYKFSFYLRTTWSTCWWYGHIYAELSYKIRWIEIVCMLASHLSSHYT